MNEHKAKRQKYSKVKPDQRQVLLEFERFTNAEIPDYQNITSENFGMVLENRCVIYLALYNLKIEKIPKSIGQLTSLRKLYLGRNKIRFLPKPIGNLKDLEILDLNNNQIEGLPIEIGDLDCLRVLNLKDNNLSTIPNSINNLPKIENLNLGGNDIKYYPDIYFALKYGIKLNQVKALLDIEQYIKRKIPCKEILSDVDVCYIKQNKNIIGLCLNICGLNKLPDSIKSLKNLRYLYLGNNLFTHLPEFICELKKLEYLELHDNKLTDLPKHINKLNSLKGISLFGNNFEEVPRSLFLLRNLEVLDLRNNKLQELPNSIKDLEKLHKFEFSGNLINRIPTSILKLKYNLKASDAKFLWKLENLLNLQIKKSKEINQYDFGYVSRNKEIKSLALYDCGLTEIPKNISRLKSLEFLYLGKNNIEIIPDYIGFMQKLTILDISNNLISKIPHSLGKLKNLKKIFLQKNKITKVANELEGFKSISVEIMLDWAKMEVLPDYLTLKCFGLRFNDLKIKLKLEELIKNKIPKIDLLDFNEIDIYKLGYSERNGHIEILCLRHLNLKKIPDYLSKLKKLRALYLDGNDLSEIPEQLYDLKKMIKLKLSNNNLTRISAKIKNFKSIQWLDLSANKLNAIPKELFENLYLKCLNLKNNNIREIPDTFPDDISLEEIYLRDNPIVKLPDSLVGVNALKILSVDWYNLESISDDLLKFQYSIEKDQALFVRDIKNIITKEFSIKDKIGFNTRGYKKDNGNIVELCLYNCNLKEIPESIGNLVYLQKLFLNNNQLKSLPQTIKKLSELNYLNIKNNKFEKLTPELYYLNKLEVLKWKGNNWEEESLQAIKKGLVYIRDYCKEIILVDIFLSHKVNEFPLFHIEEIAGYLKNQDEINNVYYCEEDLVGDIDSFMERYVPESDILIFFGSKNSIYDSKDCEKEIKLAKDNEKLFITIKSDDIEWPDFSKYNLERIKGIEWRGEDKFSEFLSELYKEILKLKREYDNQIVNAN